MSEGFSVHFPARVGEMMYLLMQGGEIREGVVIGYTVGSYVVCVELLVDGEKMYRGLASVGRTVFANRQSAEVAAKTEGEKL